MTKGESYVQYILDSLEYWENQNSTDEDTTPLEEYVKEEVEEYLEEKEYDEGEWYSVRKDKTEGR